MSELAILVPVLARPHRVRPLLESIAAATPDAHVLFLADPHDDAECSAIRRERRRTALNVDAVVSGGSYASKINEGVRQTGEPLLFAGADDLEFHPGWLKAARALMSDDVQVVGVNDRLTRAREHATHFLMARAYAEQPTIDGEPGPLFEGYAHWFCDNELIATAQRRGAYAYAQDAHVEHLHPMAGTAPMDSTYERGRAKRYEDGVLFKGRRRLWT